MEHLPSLRQVGRAADRPTPDGSEEKPQWSAWSRCESSFSLLLVPHKPGVYALAEEVIDSGSRGRRMLALFAVTQSDDLARSISQLFMPGHPLRERLGECRCFVRYTVISDPAERQEIAQALERWLLQASDRAAQMAPPSLQPATQAQAADNGAEAAPIKVAQQPGVVEPSYYVAPQRVFLHSDFVDCDPGDCTGDEYRSERAAWAVRALGEPTFPAGF